KSMAGKASPLKRKTTKTKPKTTRKPAKSGAAKPVVRVSSRSTATRKPLVETAPSLPMTTEQKMNVSGIVLLVLGLIALLALLQKSSGTATVPVSNFLTSAFGWPAYLLPVLFILIGVWFLLSKMQQFPSISADRVVGFFLLFFNIVAWADLILGWVNVEGSLGGGKVGEFLGKSLVEGLGGIAAVILLVAWLLVALVFLADLSVSSIFYWLAKRFKHDRSKFGNWIRENAARRRNIEGEHELQLESAPEAYTHIEQTNTQRPEPVPASTPFVNQNAQAASTENTENIPHWALPRPEEILNPVQAPINEDESDLDRARVIEETLRSFSTPAHVVEIRRGPSITMFGVEPDYIENSKGKTRVRVNKITGLADDLALALRAPRIRIQAPVPGKGYVGVEVPNTKTTLVSLLEIIESNAFINHKSFLKFALGKDVSGQPFTADLASMPHLLIAGTTGSGKSVCVNAILAGYLLTLTPEQLRIVLVDPKRVELTGYNGVPHLLAPVIVDAEKVIGALNWMQREMDMRYRNFSEIGVRNITEYNQKVVPQGKKRLPFILVVIDELADLMMLAPDETERALARLAQLARATGIHLILATQRPSTDILTGLIKANFPARIAFAVASNVDSRVILDQPGAERLLGRGDMLFQAPDAAAPVRLQGTFVSDAEINRLTDFWREQAVKAGAPERPDVAVFSEKPQVPLHPPLTQGSLWSEMQKDPDEDPIQAEALAIIRKEGRASVSMLQRKLRIGYTRASRIVEKLEEKGIIGPPDPQTGTREVLEWGEFPPVNED
ncbi:MAG TPA: DNA translocase FtsK 4TM domain-containing protein, partial [Anaerolineaceae bacterium]|nr:DNA translocase FtsK 4TM domain-containing protein [Anaerolineaceae bacterium]